MVASKNNNNKKDNNDSFDDDLNLCPTGCDWPKGTG